MKDLEIIIQHTMCAPMDPRAASQSTCMASMQQLFGKQTWKLKITMLIITIIIIIDKPGVSIYVSMADFPFLATRLPRARVGTAGADSAGSRFASTAMVVNDDTVVATWTEPRRTNPPAW